MLSEAGDYAVPGLSGRRIPPVAAEAGAHNVLDQGEALKSYYKELSFEVPTRRAFLNITPEVERCLLDSGIQEGLLLCKDTEI